MVAAPSITARRMKSTEQNTAMRQSQSRPQLRQKRLFSFVLNPSAPYLYVACCWLVYIGSTNTAVGSNTAFVGAWIPTATTKKGRLQRVTTPRSGRGWAPKGNEESSLQASVVPDTFESEAASGTPPSPVVAATHNDALISMTLDELATLVDGKGRAQAIWEYYRQGIDPLQSTPTSNDSAGSTNNAAEHDESSLPVLGASARKMIKWAFPNGTGIIEDAIARVVHQTTATDGTTKLLLQLQSDDKLQVEAVIIPFPERRASTLCVSSQVGCAQACTFCQTGRMGKLKSLSCAEILAQLWAATKTCRESNGSLYPIDNVVFMGMGEPADNADAVVRAAKIMTDPHGFQLAPRKVTISTVAPSPEVFAALGEAPAVLAWSVHASRDEVRRELVPTTRHSMVELRQGLLEVLQKRSKRLRATMLEITLLAGINDSVQDAQHLADFCKPFVEDASGIKLVVNLIPWNDIGAPFGPAASYQTPSREALTAFQKALMERNILCYIRTTRGDDESAACGQLATKKRPATDQ
jgi:23S rRNA (adenine2503-C2)-methyltransferase